MKALIVDDEPLARLELRRLLAAFAWIQVVGEAGNIDEARAQIETLAPDLAFLDVQMQGGTGFDLLAQLGRPPRIVFTTAYDHYAVKAFEVSALDYLLKPIGPERLAAALAKLRTAMSNQAASGDLPLQQLFIHDGPRCWFLPMREVSLFVAEGNYVRLHWGNERPVLGRSLAAVEEKLDAKTFFRANWQQIVNLDFVQNVQLGSGGRLLATLRDGSDVEISRRQARLFRARMTV
jgi:two-component system LytT family response regulator